MDAIVFVGLVVALALAAPRWGYDSTDGVDSPEYGRRAAWGSERIVQARGKGAATHGRRRSAPVGQWRLRAAERACTLYIAKVNRFWRGTWTTPDAAP